MPSGRFIAEQSTCARDAAGGILQACLEVAKALGEQEDLQSGTAGNVEQTAGLKLGLNQRRALLNSSLRQLQCARARTPTEFGMKARCFRQVKDSLGEDDTRVAELACFIHGVEGERQARWPLGVREGGAICAVCAELTA